MIDHILHDFSCWLPKAKDYGYSATDLYMTAENAVIVLIPIPIILNGDYKLWLFCIYKAERVTPRIMDMILTEISEIFPAKLSHLIERETYFIIAGIVRGRIVPKPGRKSVYVIKADYAYKIYEIIAKAVEGFVRSFRKNVKYGDDLLALCDELGKFAERMRKRAGELKIKIKPSSTSPTHHPFAGNKEELRKEAEEHLALLEKSRVIK